MKVDAFWVNTTEPDFEHHVGRLQHNQGGAAHRFETAIRSKIRNHTVTFGDQALLVIGGRSSIREAFAEFRNTRFEAEGNKLLYGSFERRGTGNSRKAFGRILTVAGMQATGPVSMGFSAIGVTVRNHSNSSQGYETVGGSLNKLNKTYTNGLKSLYSSAANQTYGLLADQMKTKTMLFLYAASYDFDGYALAPGTSGPGMALLLKQFFANVNSNS